MEKDILDILRRITTNERLNHDDELLESELLDSLGIAVLLSEIEINFGVEIEIEDVIPKNFETARSITLLLSKYIEE